MAALRRLARGLVIAFGVAFVLAALNYRTVLLATGNYLVESQTPQKADVIVVLAGDQRGDRILRAAELVRAGYAPVALVSGPGGMYGMNEATLAIQYAVRQGAPPSYFEPVFSDALSTLEEARALAPYLRKRNVHTMLLVTSNYHTRRASGIFRKVLGGQVKIITVPADNPYFGPGTWWHNREGQKIVFYEYSKTIAGWLGM